MIGIALEEGHLGGLDNTLTEMLPAYAEDMSPEVAGVTLRQLLTMTAGFPDGLEAPQPVFVNSDDWVRAILANPEWPPGEEFRYSNGTSHVLAAVLQAATGTSALDYARSRLFDPLGIDTRPAYRGGEDLARRRAVNAFESSDFAWLVDPQGVSTGWFGIRLRARDMVRIGQLYLSGGEWEGEQLVPAEWIEEATSEQVPAVELGSGYGYQWWTDTMDDEPVYRAMGYGGQLIVVAPARDLVVVTTTELRLNDATSFGMDLGVLLGIVEDAVVSQFPAA